MTKRERLLPKSAEIYQNCERSSVYEKRSACAAVLCVRVCDHGQYRSLPFAWNINSVQCYVGPFTLRNPVVNVSSAPFRRWRRADFVPCNVVCVVLSIALFAAAGRTSLENLSFERNTFM